MTAFARWLADVARGRPEGSGRFDAHGKDGHAVFIALLAFVATQSGALAVADQFNFRRWIAVLGYLALAGASIGLTARLIRLKRRSSKGKVSYYYFDPATLLFAKLVLYVSLVATPLFATGYMLGWFSPTRRSFTSSHIPMTVPIQLTEHANRNRSLVYEQLDKTNAKSLQRFAAIVAKGLGVAENASDVYVSWSTQPFDLDYDDFTCELFADVSSPQNCLAFLHSSHRTSTATAQFVLRQLYFDIDQKAEKPLRTFRVRAAGPGDRILLIFHSSKGPFERPMHSLKNQSAKAADNSRPRGRLLQTLSWRLGTWSDSKRSQWQLFCSFRCSCGAGIFQEERRLRSFPARSGISSAGP